jgi:prophage regulatory protein
MSRVTDKHIDLILRLPEVRQITGLSRSSIYALQTTQSFPHSVKLSERAVGWLESEVRIWLEARVQRRDESIEELQDRLIQHSAMPARRRA